MNSPNLPRLETIYAGPGGGGECSIFGPRFSGQTQAGKGHRERDRIDTNKIQHRITRPEQLATFSQISESSQGFLDPQVCRVQRMSLHSLIGGLRSLEKEAILWPWLFIRRCWRSWWMSLSSFCSCSWGSSSVLGSLVGPLMVGLLVRGGGRDRGNCCCTSGVTAVVIYVNGEDGID